MRVHMYPMCRSGRDPTADPSSITTAKADIEDVTWLLPLTLLERPNLSTPSAAVVSASECGSLLTRHPSSARYCTYALSLCHFFCILCLSYLERSFPAHDAVRWRTHFEHSPCVLDGEGSPALHGNQGADRPPAQGKLYSEVNPVFPVEVSYDFKLCIVIQELTIIE